MRRTILFVLASLLIMGTAGCARTVQADVVKSDKARITTPAVDRADQAALVDGNNSFAFDLYQALRQTSGNLFYSPFSISQALAMTFAGARGGTATSMAKALDFTLPQERLHPAFNSIDLQLAQRGQGAKGKDQQPFKLHIVNAIWGQRDFSFLVPFLDILAQDYGAGLRVLDFIKSPELSRVTINDWLSGQTEGKIKDLVPPGSINTLTRLVLTNAIYFNAAWAHQFKKEATASGAFTLLNGNQVTAPMMKQTQSFRYAEGPGYQAVELPYDGQQLSMVILAPQKGQFESFEKSLTVEAVKATIAGMKTTQVILSMPKFQYEASLGLKQALTALGMGVAFTDDADFSGMDGKRDLLIQDVLHKAFVSVDELGTEAAAATAVIVGTTSAPADTATLTLDRPFVFLIRDIPTGTTLFVGRVLDPLGT